MEIALRRCCRCGRYLPEASFGKNRSTKDGLSLECRSCKKEIDKTRREKLKSRGVVVLSGINSKKCPMCGEDLPLSAFCKNMSAKDGLNRICRTCSAVCLRGYMLNNRDKVLATRKEAYKIHKEKRNETARNYSLKNKDKIASYKRLKKYGLSEENFQSMLKTQGGKCYSCLAPFSNETRIEVDHSHFTGEVRGLLCGKCNRGVGFFDDNPDRLDRAANYVERLSTKERLSQTA
jgi:hypothetical protein